MGGVRDSGGRVEIRGGRLVKGSKGVRVLSRRDKRGSTREPGVPGRVSSPSMSPPSSGSGKVGSGLNRRLGCHEWFVILQSPWL